jgi:uncharacterized protein (TIGR02217 family)
MAWPVFPACPTFGFSGTPDYSVTVIERSGGVRSVNRNWYYPLHVYTAVPMGNQPEIDIYKIQRFWHAVGGRSGRFLFDDRLDNTSTDSPELDISPSDQPVVLDDANSPGVYRLFKTYEDDDALLQQVRIISKPRAGTIRVALDGVEIFEGADWDLDYDTGIITFDAPAAGVYTWGGSFYVPVMFESSPEFVLSEHKIRQTGFTLRELRMRAEDEGVDSP